MSQVDKIHWFPNHGPVNPSPLLLLLSENGGVISETPLLQSQERELKVMKTTKGRAKGLVEKGIGRYNWEINHWGMKGKAGIANMERTRAGW